MMGLASPKDIPSFQAKFRWFLSVCSRIKERRARKIEVQELIFYAKSLREAHTCRKVGMRWKFELAMISRKYHGLRAGLRKKIEQSSADRLKDKLVRKKMGMSFGTVPFSLSKAMRSPTPDASAQVPRGTLVYSGLKRRKWYRGKRKRSAERWRMVAEALRQPGRLCTFFGRVEVVGTARIAAAPEATGSTVQRPVCKMQNGKKVTSTAGPKQMIVGVAQIIRKAMKKKAVKSVFTTPTPRVEDAHAVENAEADIPVSASTATSGEDAQEVQNTPTASSGDALTVVSGDASASIGGASTVDGAESTSGGSCSDTVAVPDVHHSDGPVCKIKPKHRKDKKSKKSKKGRKVTSTVGPKQMLVGVAQIRRKAVKKKAVKLGVIVQNSYSEQQGFSVPVEHIFTLAQPTVSVTDVDLVDCFEVAVSEDVEIVDADDDQVSLVEDTFEDLTMLMEVDGDRPDLMEEYVEVMEVDEVTTLKEDEVMEEQELMPIEEDEETPMEVDDLSPMEVDEVTLVEADEGTCMEVDEVIFMDEDEATPKEEEGSVVALIPFAVDIGIEERRRQLQDEAEALLARIRGDLAAHLDSTVAHTTGAVADTQTAADDGWLVLLDEANESGLEFSDEKRQDGNVVAEQEEVGDEDVDTTLVELISGPRKDKGKQREFPAIPFCMSSLPTPDSAFTTIRERNSAQEKREARERQRVVKDMRKQQQQELKESEEPRNTGDKLKINLSAKTAVEKLKVVPPDHSIVGELSSLFARSATVAAPPPALTPFPAVVEDGSAPDDVQPGM